MTPTPTLVLNTLGALAFFEKKDEGCPRLNPIKKDWLDGSYRPEGPHINESVCNETALDHLNRVLGEVLIWLTATGEWYFECSWWKGSVDLGVVSPNHDPDVDPTDPLAEFQAHSAQRTIDELAAKCELVVAAAVASGWEGKVE